MDVRTTFILYITICIQQMVCQMRDFYRCNANYDLIMADGFLKEYTFPWLGFVQYVQEATQQVHKNKAPRVALIQKQFVLGTAVDLLRLPKTFKLGNVIFGEYEREETQCGLTEQEIRKGIKCARSYLEIPIVEVTAHPEFTRFGSRNSLALGRLLSSLISPYMIPVCLPTLLQRKKLRNRKFVFLVDYSSSIPDVMGTERMAMKTLRLYTHRDCARHRPIINEMETVDVSQVLCTSGCGVRHGAPIVTNVSESGRVELVGLAAGGGPCGDKKMRNRFNTEPPFYVDVYPYVNWILNVVTAHHIPKAYPHNFKMVDGGVYMGPKMQSRKAYLLNEYEGEYEWNGRAYVKGYYCYQPWNYQRTEFFYSETFEVVFNGQSNIIVKVEVFAGVEYYIACARVILPNRLDTPVITGVGTENITLVFNANYRPDSFYFSVKLTGKRTTSEYITN